MDERVRKAIERLTNPSGDGKTIVSHGFVKAGEKPRLEIVPHGWVKPTPTGVKAKCGGPGLCDHCQEEKRRLDAGTYPYED